MRPDPSARRLHTAVDVSGDEGAVAVEYALLAALIAVVIFSTVAALGTWLDQVYAAAEAMLG